MRKTKASEPDKTVKKTDQTGKKTAEKPDKTQKLTDDELDARAYNLDRVISKVCQLFKAPENLTVSEWADQYRQLSPENSAIPGRWKTSRTPYTKEIMDAFTDNDVKMIAVVASSQVGKTEVELNMIGYMIDQDPGSALFIMPTDQVAKDYSKRRLAPMIRDTPCIRAKVAEAKSRDSGNTITQKVYPGGMLTIFGSNSPANLAGTPARYVFGDEVDRWADSAGKEGDPIQLLERRTTTFFNSKMVLVSTPTIKGSSAIERSFNRGTKEYWSAKCPHCGAYHFVDFNSIHFKHRTVWNGGEKDYEILSINYACPDCGCLSDEKTMKNQPHKWVAMNPDAIKTGARSFWINGFSSPWTSWEKIIREFLRTYDNPDELKTVYNTLFGELWELRTDLPDEEEVMRRAEHYNAELPDGVLCLTCGVDTQDNRFEYEVVGHGFGKETWGIEYGRIQGRPCDKDTWERLDGVFDKVYRFANGRGLKISAAFVDAGGHYAQDVYEQCSARQGKRVFPSRGANKSGEPFTSPARKVDYCTDKGHVGKAWYFRIGTDSGKEHIMSALRVTEGHAHRMHFPDDESRGYDILYYKGLLSEYMDPKTMKWEIIPGHERNEPLDCRNYANAAFEVLRPNLDRLKMKLSEAPSQEGSGMAVKAPAAAKKRKHRKERFVEEW